MIQNFLPIELREGSHFNCPVCGDEIFNIEFITLCPHVLFIYQYVGVEFIIGSTPHEELIRRSIIYTHFAEVDPLETIMKIVNKPNIIFFEVTFYTRHLEQAENILTIAIDLTN